MNSHELSFCTINKIDDSIAEIIVNDGIEIDIDMVAEYHAWIDDKLSTPCGLLINKINKYTYTFEAQLKIADLQKIKSIAVICYSEITKATTKSLTKLPRQRKLHLSVFHRTKSCN